LLAKIKSQTIPREDAKRGLNFPQQWRQRQSLKEKDGTPLGEKIFSAVKETMATIAYNFPKPGGTDPVPKGSYIVKVGDEGCGVGYYKSKVQRQSRI
jgi:hypothetical protein